MIYLISNTWVFCKMNEWSGIATDHHGEKTDLTIKKINYDRGENRIEISFTGAKTRPKHMIVKWKQKEILSVTNISKDLETLVGNPGTIIWDEREKIIYFVTNDDDLATVCCRATEI